MTHHKLKSHPKYFDLVWSGEKNFEVRKNDRDFQVGDVVTLLEWDPGKEADLHGQKYTGRQVTKRISCVFVGDEALGLAMPEGTCVFGMRPLRSRKLEEKFTAREREIFDILTGVDG